MIEECHRRAMEFHAWINPYRVKNKLDDELASTHIYNRHPEWFVVYGDQLFFDPALPESREHICRVVGDIVRRYDIDAIHMDDYFILIRLRDKISQIMRALFVMVRILPIKEIGGVIM